MAGAIMPCAINKYERGLFPAVSFHLVHPCAGIQVPRGVIALQHTQVQVAFAAPSEVGEDMLQQPAADAPAASSRVDDQLFEVGTGPTLSQRHRAVFIQHDKTQGQVEFRVLGKAACPRV